MSYAPDVIGHHTFAKKKKQQRKKSTVWLCGERQLMGTWYKGSLASPLHLPNLSWTQITRVLVLQNTGALRKVEEKALPQLKSLHATQRLRGWEDRLTPRILSSMSNLWLQLVAAPNTQQGHPIVSTPHVTMSPLQKERVLLTDKYSRPFLPFIRSSIQQIQKIKTVQLSVKICKLSQTQSQVNMQQTGCCYSDFLQSFPSERSSQHQNRAQSNTKWVSLASIERWNEPKKLLQLLFQDGKTLFLSCASRSLPILLTYLYWHTGCEFLL